MVNFQLDEMQEMLKELAHEFAVDEIRPHAEHWALKPIWWNTGAVRNSRRKPFETAGCGLATLRLGTSKAIYSLWTVQKT